MIRIWSEVRPTILLSAVVIGAILIGFSHARPVRAATGGTYHPDPWAGKPPFPLNQPWPQRDDIKRPKLSEFNRLLLNNAYLKGKTKTDVMVLSRRGHNEQIRAWLTNELGGQLRFRDDTVDYLRANGIALKDLSKLLKNRDIIDFLIEASTASQNYAYNFPDGDWETVNERRGKVIPLTPAPPLKKNPNLPVLPLSELKEINPYIPTYAIGAPQFRQEHPNFDGRGTVIATVEAGLDWSGSWLDGARDLKGNPIRKVAKVIVPCDPDDTKCEYRVALGPVLTANDGFIESEGVRYKVPEPGEYRLGKHKRFVWIKDWGGEETFDVLWSPLRGALWVDIDHQHDFSSSNPVRDYNITGDVGILTRDDPATPVNEAENFALIIEPGDPGTVFLVAPNGHTTGTMAVAAGSHLGGSEMNGVAPGAQVLVVAMGIQVGIYRLAEGIIRAAEQSVTDVISLSTTGMDFPADGEGFLAQIENRVSERYGKVIVTSAGNDGPSFDSLWGLESAKEVIAVGAYEPRDTLEALYGGDWGQRKEFIPAFSSRGVSLLGLIKPEIVAPSTMLSTRVCAWGGRDVQRGENSMAHFNAPSCLFPVDGTSVSAPTIAGAVALIVSAEHQMTFFPKAAMIRSALLASAHRVDGYSAVDQGHGLVNVDAAWKYLEQKEISSLPQVDIYGPIEHPNTVYTKTPGIGAGLLVWDAWKAGDRGDRTLYLLRRTGLEKDSKYELQCRGDSESFRLPGSVDLPPSVPVPVHVELIARKNGLNSCVLDVFSANKVLVAHSALTFVVVSTPDVTGAIKVTENIKAKEVEHAFIVVPSNVAGFEIRSLVASGRPQIDLSAPDLAYPSQSREPYYLFPRYVSIFTYLGGRFAGQWDQFVSRPAAGIWEFSTSLYGRDVTSVESQTKIRPYRGELVVSAIAHPSASVWRLEVKRENGHRLSGDVGRAQKIELNTPVDLRPATVDLNVPAGTRRLLIQARANREVSLELRNCAGKKCILWDVLRPDAQGRIEREVRWPDPGKWSIVASGVALEKRSIDVDVMYFGPQFGQIVSDGASALVTVSQAESAGQPIALLEFHDLETTQKIADYPLADSWSKIPLPNGVVVARQLVPLTGTGMSSTGSF